MAKFVPMRILSLEYIQKMIHMDDLDYVVAKKKALFKIKSRVGPFVYNPRSPSKEADLVLKQMNFKLSFSWSYEPLGLISKIRVEKKTTPYSHTPRPEIV